jgi:hypothetical protein
MQDQLGQNPGVGFGGRRKAVLRILKNADVTGKPRPFPVQSYATCDVAVGTASRREQAQNVRWQFSERLGKSFRSLLPSAAHPSRHASAELS